MKNYLIILIVFSSSLIAQSLSPSDLGKLNNRQLDQLKAQLIENDPDVTMNQIVTQDRIPQVQLKSSAPKNTKKVYAYGYDFFTKDINFYDNAPTPNDYILGPGDEISLTLWGETNLKENFIIDKNGSIFYKNIGFINISDYTLFEAENILKEELSKLYSTINSSTTYLRLEINRIKSINVYFSGLVNSPGIHLIHPFSDIIQAIIQSGGIKGIGSLRNIQIIRNGKLAHDIDLYPFFNQGNDKFKKIKLYDNDTIYVPPVEKRAWIKGEVLVPGYYELKKDESLYDLIKYSYGLTAFASSEFIINELIPLEERSSDDLSYKTFVVANEQSKEIFLNNMDTVTIPKIPGVLSSVQVLGKVKAPGNYPYKNNSLKDILDLAGGFNDPDFRKSIVDEEILILRKNEENIYADELTTSYEKANNFQLFNGDKIFVYENVDYDNQFTISVNGEVVNPGFYSFEQGMTVASAIAKAGGMNILADKNAITLTEQFKSQGADGNIQVEILPTINVNPNHILSPNSKINILSKQNSVRIIGNVYSPGLITYSKNTSIKDYIRLAGGYKPESKKNKVYVKRTNGEIKVVSLFRGSFIRIKNGDVIVVPKKEKNSDFDITSFVSDLTSVLANIAAILIIVDNQN